MHTGSQCRYFELKLLRSKKQRLQASYGLEFPKSWSRVEANHYIDTTASDIHLLPASHISQVVAGVSTTSEAVVLESVNTPDEASSTADPTLATREATSVNTSTQKMLQRLLNL